MSYSSVTAGLLSAPGAVISMLARKAHSSAVASVDSSRVGI